MSLTITRARVREKCGIADTSYDSTIDNLILELAPVLEYSVRADALADSTAGVQATLNLAATEILCGELQTQRLREVGAADIVTLGDLRIEPSKLANALDLLQQGFSRLKPYLKTEPYSRTASVAAIGPQEPAE
jgi:hypothetical protein